MNATFENLEMEKNRKKTQFLSQIRRSINGLEFQKERIFDYQAQKQVKKVSVVHDVDFYVILLRRLFRQLEDLATYDSRVANLKGSNTSLLKRIKIRDHFEHGVDVETLPDVAKMELPRVDAKDGSSLHVATSLFGSLIVSGDIKWDLIEDHEKFKQVIEAMANLYPFEQSAKTSS